MIRGIDRRQVTSKCGIEIKGNATLPLFLQEHQIPGESLSCDKAFAAAWLDDQSAILGTKDNKLLLLDTIKNHVIKPITLPSRPSPCALASSCGIHSISINFSRTMLVTGTDDPSDAAVLQLPSFKHVQLLKSHNDWIFSTAWLTDSVLATGSRDFTVKLWSIREAFLNESPFQELPHKRSVRDLKYRSISERLITLNDGKAGTCALHLW